MVPVKLYFRLLGYQETSLSQWELPGGTSFTFHSLRDQRVHNIKPTEVAEVVDRSRLIVDTKKWLLSKMFPEKYGDKRRTAKLPKAKSAQPEDRQGSLAGS